MKYRYLFTVLFLFASVASRAQLGADGFYRIQNTKTTRYVRLIDNKGQVDLNTTSVDLGALQTVMYFENVVSDPSSVIYFSHMSGDEYNISCQGMNMVDMIGFGLRMQKLGSGHYVAFQEQKGLRKILNDLRGTSVYGAVLTNDSEYKEWDVLPLNSENYFGVTPDITVSGKYYKALYTGFAYDFQSAGMKAWYISQVDTKYGICVMKQISGTVPAATPVFVECSSDVPTANRLDVLVSDAANPQDNLLNGVYFDNSNKKHYNRVEYNKEDMRVLGLNADGKLAFVTDQSLGFMPANSCYLRIANAPSELVVMLEEDYLAYVKEAEENSGIDTPEDGPEQDRQIYAIDGRKMNCRLEELPAGVWIVDGKKFIVRD